MFLDSVSSPLDSPRSLPQSEPFQASAWFPLSPSGHWVLGAARLLGPLLPLPGPEVAGPPALGRGRLYIQPLQSGAMPHLASKNQNKTGSLYSLAFSFPYQSNP